ncbi:UNVERIFIED_CONTAM: Transcription factor [Sesamum angustifolium]|uniref:Transcription factor n=1 Tax=Sesamum angustifolium TaxID=2727405 RepID=A0AAW2QC45_9LAMI
MLAMAEELGHELWDDKTWEFPTFGAEEDCGGKLAADVSNSEGQAEEARPASGAAKGKKRSSAAIGTGDHQGRGGGGGESDDHELHIWTERERRKKMRNMFANLHALLPHLPAKADKSTIVDEAVNYIKKLQETLQALEKEKIDRLNGLITNNPIIYDPSIITQQRLAIQSREAFLAEQGSVALANPNPNPDPMFSGPEFLSIFKTWTSPNVILNVCGRDAHINVCSMKKPGLLTAICFVMEKHKLELVSAHVSSDRNRSMYMIHARGNGGSEQLSQAFPVEDIYKQAAAEIMLWVNS